jgi:hypothetical protein
VEDLIAKNGMMVARGMGLGRNGDILVKIHKISVK